MEESEKRMGRELREGGREWREGEEKVGKD